MRSDPNDQPAAPLPQGAELLMDGAGPALPPPPEVQARIRVARDRERSLEERVEAFEDVIDAEVGDTSLVRARNVEREHGLRQVFLKFEGGNPTGSQKDRIAFAQALDALRRGFDGVTVATCGNYGVAMALASSMAGLDCRVYIPEGYHTKRITEMTDLGAEVRRAPGTYEDVVRVSRTAAEDEELYDANPGGANVPIQLLAYGEIANEIYDDLRDAPAAVAVPVSNGTTLAGVYRGFLRLYQRGKTSRIPRLVAGSTWRKNPIVRAALAGEERCADLEPARARETVTNEPLVNWHSIDGDHALEAIRASDGWAGHVSDKRMRAHSKRLREIEGLSVLPASTAGLAALLEGHAGEPLPGDRYVAVLTGRNG